MHTIPSETLLAIIDAQVRLVGLGNDLSAVMDVASTTAATLTGADGAVVELLEDDSIVYRSASGIAERQLGLRMPVANSLSGYCLTHRTAAVCTDSETDERVNREACRKVGLRTMVIVPLIANEQAIAVMKLVWVEPRQLDHGEQDIAQLLANMMAMLMQRSTMEGPSVLRQRMTVDETTGTANRSYFYEQLQARLVAAQAGHERLAVAVIRIDGLAGLADPQEEQTVLVEVSRRIERECRVGDMVARLGRDEFAIILTMAARRSIVTSQLHRISQAISSAPMAIASDAKMRLAFQAGAALYPEDGASALELVQAAHQMLGKDGARAPGSALGRASHL
jgi:diguanylate cyclase (GGDEF)-like protein